MGAAPGLQLTDRTFFSISSTDQRVGYAYETTGAVEQRNGQNNQWQLLRVNLANFRQTEGIYINAQRQSKEVELAFDDVEVLDHTCGQPGWCDFEQG